MKLLNVTLGALGLVAAAACGGKLNGDEPRGPGEPSTTETKTNPPSSGAAGSGQPAGQIVAPGMTGMTGTTPAPSVPPVSGTGPGWLAFDSDRDGSRAIYFVRSDGTGLMRLKISSAVEIEPAFSSDGKKLAYASNETGRFQIHILDFATHVQSPLTHRPGGTHQPAWSRDGSLVAFTGIPEGLNLDAGIGAHPAPGVADLFIIGSDGGGERSVIGALDAASFYPEYYPANPAFGPDPKTIVFAGTSAIHAVGIDGKGLREIAGVPTEGTETPSVSPDGTLVAFASWDGKGEGIRVTNFAGDSRDPAHDGLSTLIVESAVERGVNRHPAWGPTGLIAYETGVFAEPANIALVPASGGAPMPLTSGSYDNRNPAWAPVGFEPGN